MNQVSHHQARSAIMCASRTAQKGFTIVELTVVMAIMGILAIFSFYQIQKFIYSGRVQPAATALQSAMSGTRVSFSTTGSPTPYSGITTASFAAYIKDTNATFQTVGSGASRTITHNLGATSAPATVAPDTLTTLGDSAAITLSSVSEYVCAEIMVALSRSAERLAINGTNVKSIGSNFQAELAKVACTDGDTNTLTITFK